MRIAVAALLLALPAAALAQQWVQYSTDVEGTVNFYDPNSVEREGDIVRVAVRRDFSRVKRPQHAAEELWLYDCRAETAGWMSFTTYGRNGEVLEQESMPREAVQFSPMRPGTTGHTLLETVCGNAQQGQDT